MYTIGNGWDKHLACEYKKNYFANLMEFLEIEYREQTIFPPRDKIFSAFNYVAFEDVKVVILGQDPYHGHGQANGMAFAVNDGIPLPPSLANIYKELRADLNVDVPRRGSLIGWAKQGVLLLNTVLTVRKDNAFSHASSGWQTFTDTAIMSLNSATKPIVFILWGAGAISKKDLISPKHCILTSAHPSPLSAHRGFFGSKPFSKANEFLMQNGRTPIDWSDIDGYEPASYYVNCKNIFKV